ncbi:MAG: VTC domain-containing protein [Bacteroidota bacterium]
MKLILDQTDVRYERKMLLIRTSLEEVLQRIHLHPAFFREVYPGRTIQNLYLDSPNLDAWRTHLDGSVTRSKFRIRWYGTHAIGQSPLILEHKSKSGLVGRKEKIALGSIGHELIREDGKHIHHAMIPSPMQERIRGMNPSLYNRYKRRYFLSLDRRLRLTVDEQIRFGRPDLSFLSELPNHIVIEYKYLPIDEQHAQTSFQEFPWRINKFSKYISGMNLLY